MVDKERVIEFIENLNLFLEDEMISKELLAERIKEYRDIALYDACAEVVESEMEGWFFDFNINWNNTPEGKEYWDQITEAWREEYYPTAGIESKEETKTPIGAP